MWQLWSGRNWIPTIIFIWPADGKLYLLLLCQTVEYKSRYAADPIKAEAENQKEMMNDVLRIAEKVREGTNHAMDIVNELQESAETVSQAVGDISSSTSATAESIQNQSAMTHDIQEHLEDTVLRAESMVKVAN